jgi:uncharacterized protein (DUF488 family)
MRRTIYTIGYEKRSIDEYVELLVAAQIDAVVDVRETAWSYKPGFSKTAFEAALAARGIRYVHAKFAGNPKAIRRNASSHNACLAAYRQYLDGKPDVIVQLDEVIIDLHAEGRRVALTCFERHPGDCHRSIVADAIAAAKRWHVEHLAGEGCRRLATA